MGVDMPQPMLFLSGYGKVDANHNESDLLNALFLTLLHSHGGCLDNLSFVR